MNQIVRKVEIEADGLPTIPRAARAKIDAALSKASGQEVEG